MLIGAHVSTSGGLPKAVERGVETESTAIQIFNQSPRMWRPTKYTDDDFAAFRDAMADSPVDAVVIHAIYLINPGTFDDELAREVVDCTDARAACRRRDRRVRRRAAPRSGDEGSGVRADDQEHRCETVQGRRLTDTDECKLLLENAAGKNAVGGEV